MLLFQSQLGNVFSPSRAWMAHGSYRNTRDDAAPYIQLSYPSLVPEGDCTYMFQSLHYL